MKEVLIIFLEMSICGSAAYLLYLLTVHSFGKHLSSSGRYAFLKAAALLFMLPISKALAPIFSLTERLTEATSNVANMSPVILSPSESAFVSDTPAQMVVPSMTLPHAGVNVPSQMAPETAPKIVDVMAVLTVIWLIGIAFMLIWRLTSRLRFERDIKGTLATAGEEIMSVYRRCCESMGVTRNIPVYTCEKVYTPMIVGAINPRIILPYKPISPKSLEFVFRHELTHYQRGDIFVKVFVSLESALHWFNPLVHIFRRNLIASLELSCDERAGRLLDHDGRKDYCMAILEAVPIKRNADVGLIFGISGKKKLKKRLDNMLNYKKMRLSQKIIAVVIAVVIIAVSCVLVACAIPVEREGIDSDTEMDFREHEISFENQNEKETESNAKYIALLTEWAYDKQNISDTHANFPEFYGGAYINDEANLVILVTNLTDETKDYFGMIIDLENVFFETADYSFATLIAEHDLIREKIVQNADNANISKIISVGISIPKNSIELYVLPPNTSENAEKYYADVKKSVTTFDKVIIVNSDGIDDVKHSVGSDSDDMTNNSDIIMTIVSSTISPTGATVEISNNGANDVYIGNDYYIQKKVKNDWISVDGHMDFFMDARILMAEQSLSITLDWSNYYGELPSGEYRIEKVVSLFNGESVSLFCEFSI